MKKRVIRIIFSVSLLVLAVVYLWRAAHDDGTDLKAAVWLLDPAMAIAAVLLFMPMYFVQSSYHAAVLDAMADTSGGHRNREADRASYLQSQIVRYLPGKVWGLVYQVHSSTARHPGGRILAANLWQTAMTNALSVAIALPLVLFGLGYLRGALACLLALLGTGLVLLAHQSGLPKVAHAWLLSRFPGSEFFAHARPPRSPPSPGFSLLLAEWLFFAAGFGVLAMSAHSIDESIAMIGWYAGSSTLSVFAIAVPAGLAVREALFVSAHDPMSVSGTALLALATQARVCMLVAEIGACLVVTAKWKMALHD